MRIKWPRHNARLPRGDTVVAAFCFQPVVRVRVRVRVRARVRVRVSVRVRAGLGLGSLRVTHEL